MRKPRLYIETSVWGFLFDDVNSEKRAATKRLFAEIEDGMFEIFISEAVLIEVDASPAEKWNLIRSAIDEFKPVLLDETDDIDSLLDEYVKIGILTKNIQAI